MTRSAYLCAAVFGLFFFAQSGLTEDLGRSIFIQIKNHHGDAREVQVLDHVCERLVLDGQLGSHNTKDVELCTRHGQGEITITDLRSGKREHHRQVLEGMWFATP